MQKNQFRIVRVSMLLFVVATFSFAQAPLFVSTNPSQILTAFQAARGNWVANIAGYANSLFGALAMIEFAWSAAVMVLEKADLQSFTAALIRKIMWIGGFYMLLINGPVWIPFIIDSFTQIGQNSSGVMSISPSNVFGQGLNVAGALSNGFSIAGDAVRTLSPTGTRSVTPHNVHHRPFQPRVFSCGAPPDDMVSKICAMPSSQALANPSMALVSTAMVKPWRGNMHVPLI